MSIILGVKLSLFLVLILSRNVRKTTITAIVTRKATTSNVLLCACGVHPRLQLRQRSVHFSHSDLERVASFSALAYIRRSIVGFKVLVIRKLMGDFNAIIVTTFTTTIGVSSFTCVPIRRFKGTFSAFVTRGFKTQGKSHVHQKIHDTFLVAVIFSLVVSLLIFFFTGPLVLVFIHPSRTRVLHVKARCLHVRKIFCLNVKVLFLLCNCCQTVHVPKVSIILAVLSLNAHIILSC